MFSSQDLISFVFANENDTYYRDDLQKLKLDQHLWYQLHERFETVYFLCKEDDTFQAYSFGDRKGKSCPDLKKGFLKSAEKTLGDWILKQMRKRTDHAVAIVCTLQSFCDIFSDKKWKKMLRELKEDQSRTGIFVLTASIYAEDNTRELLSSPVFDYLGETAVTDQRSGDLRNLYDAVYERKWGSCFFLNAFGREQVYGLLLHVVMAYPQRLMSMEHLNKLANGLYDLLNTSGCAPLFEFPFPTKYLMFKELYNELCKEAVWERLVQKSKDSSRPSGAESCVPILRKRDSYASSCLRLVLPSWLKDGESAESLLREICEAVSVPKNRLENPQILGHQKYFLDFISSVSQGDSETYMIALRALKFCTEQAYILPNSDKLKQVLEIIQFYGEASTNSAQYFKLKRIVDAYDADSSGMGVMQKKNLPTLKKKLEFFGATRERLSDYINVSIQNLNAPSAEHAEEILQKICLELEKIPKTEAEPELPPDLYEEPEQTKEDKVEKTPKDELKHWGDPYAGLSQEERARILANTEPPKSLKY